MQPRLLLLIVLALIAQVVNASWHGFDLVEDGLQLISAATLAALVVALVRARSRRRTDLILRVLDELGQPLTVLRGYLSMLRDGSLASLNGHTQVLLAECDRLDRIGKQLVQTIRERY
jgi:signal transduction histidine kinase